MDTTAPIETPQEKAQDPFDRLLAPVLFLGAAVIYNAILAMLNAHVMHVSQGTVIVAEGIIVLGAVAYLMTKLSLVRNCPEVLLFQLAMLVIFLGVTLLSEFLNVKAFRDIFLITVFFLLGTMTSRKRIIQVFTILTILTLFFLLMEAYATDAYAGLFNPASYYANTRGLTNPDFNDSGIFVNALSFEGRFTLGILNVSHRLSSLFIEQVSLGNFAIILSVFLSLLWKDMTWRSRVVLVGTIFLILATNNSRTAILLSLLIFIGHIIFPKLPRFTHMIYLPLTLIAVVTWFDIPQCINESTGRPFLLSDDIQGRLGLSACSLRSLTYENLLGFKSDFATPFWDSGFVYFINSESLLGLIVFWLFCSLAIKPATENGIRVNHYLALAIFINMFTSMALFSIKVSGPLWFIAGYVYMQQKNRELKST
ncbi:MAG TPA: hypothetical protein PLK94_04355 [Alphaproteobacteria bacterium]|nr:hypothetical protein [Alphaproteobacteria bacterium]HOO50503.1 hypothetical protein [Alphaproteobacteria bacterium]